MAVLTEVAKPAYFHGGPMHGMTELALGRRIVLIPEFHRPRKYPSGYARYVLDGRLKDGRLRYKFDPPK